MKRPSPTKQQQGNDIINNTTASRRGSFIVGSDFYARFPTQRHIKLLALFLVMCSLFQICFLAVTIPSYYTPSDNPYQNDIPILKFGSSHPPESPPHYKDNPTATSNNNDGMTMNQTTTKVLVDKQRTTKLDSNNNNNRNHHRHKIPRNLLFTHYRNLLLKNESEDFNEEEMALSQNVYHSIQVSNPDSVYFFTDEDCIQSLQRVFPSLIPYFKNESQGMYKADICRGSTLYENGGFYFDVDVGVRHDPWEDLVPTTEFVTSKVHKQSKYINHFFQAILGASPKSTILYKYLELFYNHYTGKDVVVKGPLGVILLRRAWDQIYDIETDQPGTELYSEVLYNKKVFPDLHPAPTWGVRRACHFVVVAKVNFPINHTEFIHQNNDFHFRIPFYSRIGGSRMCPITPENKTTTTEKKVEEKK